MIVDYLVQFYLLQFGSKLLSGGRLIEVGKKGYGKDKAIWVSFLGDLKAY